MNTPKIRAVYQLGAVVPNLEAGVEKYSEILGIDKSKWVYFDTREMPEGAWGGQKYLGKDVSFHLRFATANFHGLQYEVIEPIGDGENFYTAALKETDGRGGFNHISAYFDNFEETVEYYKSIGAPIISELDMGGTHVYFFDLRKEIGTIIETYKVDYWYVDTILKSE